jgi:hypothetical protein
LREPQVLCLHRAVQDLLLESLEFVGFDGVFARVERVEEFPAQDGYSGEERKVRMASSGWW